MSDLIIRQAAIDAIEHVTWYHQNRNGQMVSGANSDEHQAWYKAEDVYEAIEALPSADRPQKWTPCSERLPSIGEKVLVSTKKTCFVQVFKGIYSDPTRWLWEHNSIKKIDAWMPLPEPFEPQESEEKWDD